MKFVMIILPQNNVHRLLEFDFKLAICKYSIERNASCEHQLSTQVDRHAVLTVNLSFMAVDRRY